MLDFSHQLEGALEVKIGDRKLSPVLARAAATVLVALTPGLLTLPTFAQDTILVRPAQWTEAIQPWKEFRESQGHEFIEVDANPKTLELDSRLKEIYAKHRETLRFIVLIGDVDPRIQASIGTFYRDSTAMVQFGGDKRIGTDNPYADFDDDDVPDLALARIPADSAEHLQAYLNRVIEYETKESFDTWRRDVHIVAGVGGFGAVADSVIEMTTRRFLADRVPGWSELSMTQASTDSHYCPDPYRFSEVTTDRMNQGGLFWVYIGHGHVRTLDYVRVEEKFVPIFLPNNIPAVNCKHAPIAIFLACYTGAYDATQDSLAEELLLKENGPIATIAASRVSGPYGLAMLADGLLDNFYVDRVPTLGQVVQLAKKRLLAPELEDTGKQTGQIQMITAIASAMSPEDYELRAERLEHVWQMHMLGDPLLKLSYPKVIELEVPAKSQPGVEIEIRGVTTEACEGFIEFAYRREKVRRELDAIPVDAKTEEGKEAYQQRYKAANDRILVKVESSFAAGPFSLKLKIPEDLANGKYCVRMFGKSAEGWQVGYKELSIRKPRD